MLDIQSATERRMSTKSARELTILRIALSDAQGKPFDAANRYVMDFYEGGSAEIRNCTQLLSPLLRGWISMQAETTIPAQARR